MSSSSILYKTEPKIPDWRTVPSESDGDSFYINDCRKIQENVRLIQNSALVAYKLCGVSEGLPAKSESDVFSMIGAAKNAAVETQALLRHLREYVQVSRPDRAQRVLMYSKLSTSFQESLKALEVTATSQVLREHLRCVEGNNEVAVGSLATTRRPTSGRSGSGGYSSYTSSNYEYASGGSLEYKVPDDNVCSVPESIGDYPIRVEEAPENGFMGNTYENRQMYKAHSGHEGLSGFTVWSTDLEQEIVRERDAGIVQIKKDIEGIQRLYKEMSFYVHNQGNDLDSIESQMRNAAEHSARATGEVTRARSFQSSRSRIMVIFLLVLILLTGILFIINMR